jgi:hypothetical protein
MIGSLYYHPATDSCNSPGLIQYFRVYPELISFHWTKKYVLLTRECIGTVFIG